MASVFLHMSGNPLLVVILPPGHALVPKAESRGQNGIGARGLGSVEQRGRGGAIHIPRVPAHIFVSPPVFVSLPALRLPAS
jgi:hypothetical protein